MIREIKFTTTVKTVINNSRTNIRRRLITW